MGHTITCKYCKKKWEDTAAYLKEVGQNGKHICDPTPPKQEPAPTNKRRKTVKHIKFGSVLSFYDAAKPVYALDVPRVIVTNIFPA